MTGTPDESEERIVEERGALLSFLRRRTRDAAQVEDVAQEALFQAWRRRETYDPSRPIRPWLRTIALRILTAGRKRRRPDITADLPRIGTAPNLVTSQVADAEILAKVEGLVAKFDSVCRRVFEAFYVEQRSIAEIGAELRMPENTIKSHLRRIRTRIAAELEDEE